MKQILRVPLTRRYYKVSSLVWSYSLYLSSKSSSLAWSRSLYKSWSGHARRPWSQAWSKSWPATLN